MQRHFLILVVAIVGVLGVILGILYINVRQQPIPQRVLRAAGFGLWYPARSTNFVVAEDTIKFSTSGSDKIVTFVAKRSGQTVTFTEQAVPESFTDVPQVYDKLIEKLHGYSSFDSINGTVQLTRPDELKGAQAAVLRSRGTLLFIKPDSDFSVNDWRLLINNLEFAH